MQLLFGSKFDDQRRLDSPRRCVHYAIRLKRRVPMIQEAHVGIGISGNEGMQAVRASDCAIAQFRFLENLLLQHGRMNYRRIAVVILYSFYKNCVLVTMLFWFNFFNGFSGSALLYGNVQAMYNFIFTSFPIMVYGVLDRDVEFKSCSRFPVLYEVGQKKQGFNVKTNGHLDAFRRHSLPGSHVHLRARQPQPNLQL